MKKIIVLIFIVINFVSIKGQTISIEKIKEYDNENDFKLKYPDFFIVNKKYLDFDVNTVLSKNSTNKEIIKNFNVKTYSPDKQYYIANYLDEEESKYLGFFDKNDKMLNYYEAYCDRGINFSSNSDYVVIYSFYQEKFLCFDRKGNLKYLYQKNDLDKKVANTELYKIGNLV